MLDLYIENHLPDCLIRKLKNVSSNINEAIRGNFRLFFLQKNFTHKKVYKMQASDFYPDVSIRPESIKKQTSNFYS